MSSARMPTKASTAPLCNMPYRLCSADFCNPALSFALRPESRIQHSLFPALLPEPYSLSAVSPAFHPKSRFRSALALPPDFRSALAPPPDFRPASALFRAEPQPCQSATRPRAQLPRPRRLPQTQSGFPPPKTVPCPPAARKYPPICRRHASGTNRRIPCCPTPQYVRESRRPICLCTTPACAARGNRISDRLRPPRSLPPCRAVSNRPFASCPFSRNTSRTFSLPPSVSKEILPCLKYSTKARQ